MQDEVESRGTCTLEAGCPSNSDSDGEQKSVRTGSSQPRDLLAPCSSSAKNDTTPPCSAAHTPAFQSTRATDSEPPQQPQQQEEEEEPNLPHQTACADVKLAQSPTSPLPAPQGEKRVQEGQQRPQKAQDQVQVTDQQQQHADVGHEGQQQGEQGQRLSEQEAQVEKEQGQRHQQHAQRQQEQGVASGHASKRPKTHGDDVDQASGDDADASSQRRHGGSSGVIPWNQQAQHVTSSSTSAFRSWRATQAIRARRNRRNWRFYKKTKAEVVAVTGNCPQPHLKQQKYQQQQQQKYHQPQPQQQDQQQHHKYHAAQQQSQQASISGLSPEYSGPPNQRLAAPQVQGGAGYAPQGPQVSPHYAPHAYSPYQQQQQQQPYVPLPAQPYQYPQLQPQGQIEAQQPQTLPMVPQQYLTLQQQVQLQQQQQQQQQFIMTPPDPRAFPQDPSAVLHASAAGAAQAFQHLHPCGSNLSAQPSQAQAQDTVPCTTGKLRSLVHPLVAHQFAGSAFALHPGMASMAPGAAPRLPHMYTQIPANYAGTVADANPVFPVRRPSGGAQ